MTTTKDLLADALRELIALKDLKEGAMERSIKASMSKGANPSERYHEWNADYKRRKPLAWEAARAALASHDAAQSAGEAQQVEANMDEVICPACCHQFRAIPVNVQKELADMEARKDAAYLERNQVVAALAKAFPSGVARTAIEGWSEDWHGCVYIDLPTGQASWHFHDSQAYLFDGLPPYAGKWDGHTTEEKYARLAALKAGEAPVPVAWVGPVGQLMPHLIYEAWSKAYPDDAAHFMPLVHPAAPPSPAVERDERAETWKALYRKAVNCANGLTNYVEDRPELRRIERELTAIESAARAALEGEKP